MHTLLFFSYLSLHLGFVQIPPIDPGPLDFQSLGSMKNEWLSTPFPATPARPLDEAKSGRRSMRREKQNWARAAGVTAGRLAAKVAPARQVSNSWW